MLPIYKLGTKDARNTVAMVSSLDALRTAKLLLDQHGAKEASRMLTARAIDEHLAGQVGHCAITQQVLSALYILTRGPERDK